MLPAFIPGLQNVAVKVGHTLAFEETSCLLTLVFEIITREHAEHLSLCTVFSAYAPLNLVRVPREFLMELCWRGLFVLFNVAEKRLWLS